MATPLHCQDQQVPPLLQPLRTCDVRSSRTSCFDPSRNLIWKWVFYHWEIEQREPNNGWWQERVVKNWRILLNTSKPVGFARCLREGVCHRALIIDSFHKNILWLLPYPNFMINLHLFDDQNLLNISYPMLFISSKNSQHNQSYNVSKFCRIYQTIIRN